MTFETEYQLQEFRELQSNYFDEDGKAYTGTIFNLEMCERMLKLINQLESEIQSGNNDWEKTVYNMTH